MRGHASRQEIEEPQQVLGVLGEQHRLRIGVVFHIYVVRHIACYSKNLWLGRNWVIRVCVPRYGSDYVTKR